MSWIHERKNNNKTERCGTNFNPCVLVSGRTLVQSHDFALPVFGTKPPSRCGGVEGLSAPLGAPRLSRSEQRSLVLGADSARALSHYLAAEHGDPPRDIVSAHAQRGVGGGEATVNVSRVSTAPSQRTHAQIQHRTRTQRFVNPQIRQIPRGLTKKNSKDPQRMVHPKQNNNNKNKKKHSTDASEEHLRR